MEADMRFGIPSGLRHRDQPIRVKGVGHQDDEAKEAQKRRRRASNSRHTPLALGLEAEVGAAFFKSHVKRPAFDEGADDGRCWVVRIGGKKGAQGSLACRVASPRPNESAAGVVPVVYQRAVPVVQSIRVVVPAYQGTRLRCQRVVGCVARAANVAKRSPTTRGRPRGLATGVGAGKEPGIEPQRRNQGHRLLPTA